MFKTLSDIELRFNVRALKLAGKHKAFISEIANIYLKYIYCWQTYIQHLLFMPIRLAFDTDCFIIAKCNLFLLLIFKNLLK